MSTCKTTISITPEMLEAGRLRGISVEHESFSAYVVALIRMDILRPESIDHEQARRINGLSWKKKEQIEAAMLRKEKDASSKWAAVEADEIKSVEVVLGQLGRSESGPLRKLKPVRVEQQIA